RQAHAVRVFHFAPVEMHAPVLLRRDAQMFLIPGSEFVRVFALEKDSTDASTGRVAASVFRKCLRRAPITSPARHQPTTRSTNSSAVEIAENPYQFNSGARCSTRAAIASSPNNPETASGVRAGIQSRISDRTKPTANANRNCRTRLGPMNGVLSARSGR